MKKLLANGWMRPSVIWATGLLSALLVCIALAAKPTTGPNAISDYDRYVADGFSDLQALTTAFNEVQAQGVIMIPPSANYMVFYEGVHHANFKRLPRTLVKGLVGVPRNGYVVYPLLVWELQNGDYTFVNALGETIYSVPADRTYDSRWILLQRLPDVYETARTQEDLDELAWQYNPARVVVRLEMVDDDGLTDMLDAGSALSAMAAPMAIMSMASAASLTNMQFIGMEQTSNGTLELTLAWPTNGIATNAVEFYACTNLLDPDWEIILTTNVNLSTNTFTWIDEDSTNSTTLFYDCWTLFDSDGDNISDGREVRIYDTDEDLWDTDGDGVSDGYELDDETDPLDENDPPNVKGSIDYTPANTPQTGVFHAVAVTTTNAWATNYSDVVSSTGAYHIVNIPTNTYYIKAWIDSDSDSARDSAEAQGLYINNPVVVTGQVTGADITLTDPDSDLDGMVDWWETAHGLDPASATGDDGAAGDPDNDNMSNLWEYSYGYDPGEALDALSDSDGDGFLNVYECQRGSDPLSSGDTPLPDLIVTNGVGRDIQDAIDDASADYAIVMVKDGTFTGSRNRDLTLGGKCIMLFSENGPSSTIIDCEDSGRGFILDTGESRESVIKGVSIRDASLGGTQYGAGILVSNSSPTIMDCVITSNHAYYGSGIACRDGAAPLVLECSITENEPGYAGVGLASSASSPIISGCTISDNVGTTTASIGGGVYAVGGQPVFSNCVITGNEAIDGAGAYFSACTGLLVQCSIASNTAESVFPKTAGVVAISDLLISNSLVFANHSGGYSTAAGAGMRISGNVTVVGSVIASNTLGTGMGAGIAVSPSSAGSPVIRSCIITNNSVTSSGDGGGIAIAAQPSSMNGVTVVSSTIVGNTAAGLGGGVYVDDLAPTNTEVRSCLLLRNEAQGASGGGIYCSKPLLATPARDVIVTHCTVVSNSASASGGGIYVDDNRNVAVAASILWENAAGQMAYTGAAPSVTNSRVQGGLSWAAGSDVTAEDPRLWFDGYHLRSTNSPAAEVAEDSSPSGDDIDAEQRLWGLQYDIGCDEFVDSDEDSLPDWWELQHFAGAEAAVATVDSDGDGVTNLYEFIQGTDPNAALDENSNSVYDDAERWADAPDQDGDLLNTYLESWLGTQDDYWDSDDDGMGDGWEWTYGFAPNSPNSGSADTDGDGWTDAEEANHGTDPTSVDTDGDETSDSADVDPLDPNYRAVTNGQNTSEITLLVGDRSPSHTERYKLVVGGYSLLMSHVNANDYEFTKTVRVARGKTYSGYLQSLSDGDDDGDYTADVYGPGVTVSDPWTSDASGCVLGGHHEDSGFNVGDGQRTFTITVNSALAVNSEESADSPNPNWIDANSVDPINTINGNVSVRDTDLAIPAPVYPLVLQRAYNSRSELTNSTVGARWTHSYDWRLADQTNHVYRGVTNDWKVLQTGDGDLCWFKALPDGSFETPPDRDYRLVDGTDHYDLLVAGRTHCHFTTNGYLLSVSNMWGQCVDFSYVTNADRVVVSEIEHSNGQTLDFSYGGAGLLSQVTTSTNTLYVTYAHNAQGELTNVTRYASGNTYETTYSYGDHHSLTQRVNAAGDVFAYSYTFVTNADDIVIAKGTNMHLNGSLYQHGLEYDVTSNRTALVYRRGSTNQVYDYRYEPDSLAISAIHGPGGSDQVVRYTRDGAQNLTRVKQSDESIDDYLLTSLSFDARRNVTSEAVSYSAAPLYSWNYVWNMTNGTLLRVTDPAGNMVTNVYAGTLPVEVITYPTPTGPETTTFGYTSDGLLSGVTNANGHWVRYRYDSSGSVTSAIPQAGPEIGYAYDSLGYLRRITMPGASGTRTTTLVPDNLGRVTSLTYPGGALSESFLYDEMGNLTNHTDAAHRTTSFTYAPTRKLKSITRGSGDEEATTSFAYDQQFNTLTITDPLDRLVEAYVLDIQDRPLTITNIEAQTMSHSYGVGSIVKSVERFDGTTVSNLYDRGARLSDVVWPDVRTTYRYYDNALLKFATNESASVSNSYDGAGRLIKDTLTLPSSSSVNDYALDGGGNVTNLVLSVDGTHVLTNAYVFDAAERFSEIDGEGGAFEVDYDAYNGFVAQVSNTTSGVRAEFTYDALDRLTDIAWRSENGTHLRSFAYQYNDVGMVTNVSRETGDYTAYEYDSLDRLTSATVCLYGGNPTDSRSWKYDLAGNRTQSVANAATMDYTLGLGNRLASFGASGTVRYDAAGNATNVVYTDGNEFDLEWNSRYELTAIYTNGTLAESYTYGPLGRRLSISDGVTTNCLVYSGEHIVAEVDADGALLRAYQHGPGIDNLLAFTDYTGGETNTYYALTDHLGTVHAWSAADGSIVEQYEYTAWGEVTVRDGSGSLLDESAIGNRFTFQGREYSWDTGLHYFRARWYDPITGRWLSKDPIGIAGGLNQYVAFANNPVNMIDPDGLNAYVIRLGNELTGHRFFAVDNPSGGMTAYHFYARGHHAGASAWNYAKAFVYDRVDMWPEQIPDPQGYLSYNLRAGTEIAIEAIALGTSADDAQMLYEMDEKCGTENSSGYYSIFGGRHCNAMAWQSFRQYAGFGNTVDLSRMNMPSGSPLSLVSMPGFAWTTRGYDRANLPSLK